MKRMLEILLALANAALWAAFLATDLKHGLAWGYLAMDLAMIPVAAWIWWPTSERAAP